MRTVPSAWRVLEFASSVALVSEPVSMTTTFRMSTTALPVTRRNRSSGRMRACVRTGTPGVGVGVGAGVGVGDEGAADDLGADALNFDAADLGDVPAADVDGQARLARDIDHDDAAAAGGVADAVG